jgi:proteasome lid subunit RPN8/RPN11
MFDHLDSVIKAHAEREFPLESVGFVVRPDPAQPEQYVEVENISHKPLEDFAINQREGGEYMHWLPHLVAVVHSHPAPFSDAPSAFDIARQIDNYPVFFGIVHVRKPDEKPVASKPYYWGDGIPDVPLEGRPFRSGPTGTDGKGDCFALVRDYYRPKGLVLPDVPRDIDWYKTDPELYQRYAKQCGFERIGESSVREGDGFLMHIGKTKAWNHGGVYIGKNLILHHLENQLSMVQPLGHFRHLVQVWFRAPIPEKKSDA